MIYILGLYSCDPFHDLHELNLFYSCDLFESKSEENLEGDAGVNHLVPLIKIMRNYLEITL